MWKLLYNSKKVRDFSIMTNKGKIFVISGPSGVGKGTLLGMLLKRHPQIKFSISATTRKPRAGEAHGVNYFFVEREDFLASVENEEFLEWAEFAGNYYGTYQRFVENIVAQGEDIALEIEVQGAMQVRKKLPEAIFIFIKPPSIKELESRLMKRNTETAQLIDKRLAVASKELESADDFDYVVINDDIESALKQLEDIIIAERTNV